MRDRPAANLSQLALSATMGRGTLRHTTLLTQTLSLHFRALLDSENKSRRSINESIHTKLPCLVTGLTVNGWS